MDLKNESNDIDYSVRLTLDFTVTARPVSFWLIEITGLWEWFENNDYFGSRDN